MALVLSPPAPPSGFIVASLTFSCASAVISCRCCVALVSANDLASALISKSSTLGDVVAVVAAAASSVPVVRMDWSSTNVCSLSTRSSSAFAYSRCAFAYCVTAAIDSGGGLVSAAALL